MRRSARFRCTAKLRFGTIAWGSWVPLARYATVMRSPPTIRAMAASCSVVATTFTLASALAWVSAVRPTRRRMSFHPRLTMHLLVLSTGRSRRPGRLQGGDELPIELLEEIERRLDSQVLAQRAGEDQGLGPGLPRDLIDDRPVLIGLCQDELDSAPLHAVDQRRHVGRAGRQGLLRFDVVEDLQAVASEQIVPAPVVADELHPP